MNSSATASAVDLQYEDQSTDTNNLPLLLQPSYARSKSLISDELRNFRIYLKWCALDHSSSFTRLISYLTFTILTIIVPLLSIFSINLPDSSSSAAGDSDPPSFNKLVQIPESALSAIAFITLSRFFSRYGLRHLLFLDGLQLDSSYVRRGYSRELDKSFRHLACILLPSFLIELAHKIIYFTRVNISLPLIKPGFSLDAIMFVLVLGSWIYRTGVFLLVCVLFRLTCELQILRLQGLHKMFDGYGSASDPGFIFKEHVRIRKQLWVTSHRYRFFIIGCWVTISVSQLTALLLVLASKSEINFFNSGDLMVCSVVKLSGFFMCLMGAARITHRAQRTVSMASSWQMFVTCATSTNSDPSKKGYDREDVINGRTINLYDCDQCPGADTDSDSSDVLVSVSSSEENDPSNSFQTRQALVTYLQHNSGGITLFGFALDRGLLHTLFAFETSLVLWILSKVVVFP